MPNWNVIYYTSNTGTSPVTDFVDSLDDRAQGKVINTVRLLREFGVQLGGSHTKELKGTDIWELRILGGDSIRVFYVAIEQHTFLLLHGFKKKSYATPTKEIKLTIKRLSDYQSRK